MLTFANLLTPVTVLGREQGHSWAPEIQLNQSFELPQNTHRDKSKEMAAK